jgi:hypothetical protein
MAHDWSDSATTTLGFDILRMENKDYIETTVETIALCTVQCSKSNQTESPSMHYSIMYYCNVFWFVYMLYGCSSHKTPSCMDLIKQNIIIAYICFDYKSRSLI